MNTIISVGFRGVKHCFLNISEEQAISRYCLSLGISSDEFFEFVTPIEKFNFIDEFFVSLEDLKKLKLLHKHRK